MVDVTRRGSLGIAASALAMTAIAPTRAARARDGSSWRPAWTANPSRLQQETPGRAPQGRVIRQTMLLSASGGSVRLWLNHGYGRAPVIVRGIAAARQDTTGGRITGPSVPVSFGGEGSVTLWPGARMQSDAVALPVERGQHVCISLILDPNSALPTIHECGGQTCRYAAPGVALNAPDFTPAFTTEYRVLTDRIDVLTTRPTPLIVTIGDSITDLAGSTTDTDRRWSDFLLRRLIAAGQPHAVANAGIAGATLLNDTESSGRGLLTRLDDDLLSLPGVSTAVLMIGINDIGSFKPGTAVSLDDLGRAMIAGYKQAALRVRGAGVRLLAATMTPYQNIDVPGYYSAEKDALRRSLNDWMRKSDLFDGLIDFDQLLRDPDNPARLLPNFDCGDHIHPSDAGCEAMAAAVDLRILTLGR